MYPIKHPKVNPLLQMWTNTFPHLISDSRSCRKVLRDFKLWTISSTQRWNHCFKSEQTPSHTSYLTPDLAEKCSTMETYPSAHCLRCRQSFAGSVDAAAPSVGVVTNYRTTLTITESNSDLLSLINPNFENISFLFTFLKTSKGSMDGSHRETRFLWAIGPQLVYFFPFSVISL